MTTVSDPELETALLNSIQMETLQLVLKITTVADDHNLASAYVAVAALRRVYSETMEEEEPETHAALEKVVDIIYKQLLTFQPKQEDT
jgi:hypothetical protein